MKRYIFILILLVLFLTNTADSTGNTAKNENLPGVHQNQNLHHHHSEEEELLLSKIFIDCLSVPIEFVDETEEIDCNVSIFLLIDVFLLVPTRFIDILT